MHVVLIPFFLAAHLPVDNSSRTWEYGGEFTFQVRVNSTAIPEEGIYGSMRLNLDSKLICQSTTNDTLSCHFQDSQADSYVTDSLDPSLPAIPAVGVSRQEAYEMNENQFEIKFGPQGLESLLVAESIQPQELDMMRVIIGQLNVGVTVDEKIERTFELMENFTQGECFTTVTVERKAIDHSFLVKRDYTLESPFGVKEGEVVEIAKMRNLGLCRHKVPYYFGSAESFRQISDVLSTVSASESHVAITTGEFISGISNIITTNKLSEGMVTTLYEKISLRLESIKPATYHPPSVPYGEKASIFIGRWMMDSLSEEEFPNK